jgi:ATP-dependent protease ClpP protease subunit
MPDSIYLLPIQGVIGKDFKYTDVLMHINAAKNSTYIKLLVDSPGGYIGEGEKIREALVSTGKVMFAANTGDVASYAVTLFEIAPKGNRVYDPAKGQFLIHMPFVTPEDGVSGTASDLDIIAKELKKLQNNIVTEYVKATGSDMAVLEGFMNENIPLTPEQVESLGFATVQRVQLKAVAYFKPINDMDNLEITKKMGVLETLLNKVASFIMPKALMLQDVNGKEVDFGPDVQTPEQIAVGVKATVDGTPAQGDVTMASGEVYQFEAGVLKAIVPKADAPDPNAELKAENEALKAELSAMKAEAMAAKTHETESVKQLKTVQDAFAAFKNEFSTGDPAPATPGVPPVKKVAFSKADMEKQFSN